MEKFVINGGIRLSGRISVSGAKNVALKALVAACLTDEEVIIENIPLISDFFVMADIIEHLGGTVVVNDHSAKIVVKNVSSTTISLEAAAEIRTSSMFISPLLARLGKAVIPNPGGCRIGARPIDRTIDGLRQMGASIRYNSEDGYFHASAKMLTGTGYQFAKNTHTGTETLLLAAVLAKGETVLDNAAQEPEVDELITLLRQMGANIQRTNDRKIVIQGVSKLHGATFRVSPDRNEIVTLAVASIVTNGDIIIENVAKQGLLAFLEKFLQAGGGFEEQEGGLRFYAKRTLKPTDVTTSSYPGFMTDWQGPWAVLMTQANGTSIIHETVYESRFAYVSELKKMGAHIELFNPVIENSEAFYNFNLADDKTENFHAAKIVGQKKLHNAAVTISDLRAGATLVVAALAAGGESVVFGVEHLDRGYERFDERLQKLGADIKRIVEDQ